MENEVHEDTKVPLWLVGFVVVAVIAGFCYIGLGGQLIWFSPPTAEEAAAERAEAARERAQWAERQRRNDEIEAERAIARERRELRRAVEKALARDRVLRRGR